MINISFYGTEPNRYFIQFSSNVIGRQWDNISEAFKITKPAEQLTRVCSMVFYFENRFVDMIVLPSVAAPVVDISNYISQYPYIDISFRFTDTTGYQKGTEIKRFQFAPSQKPANFVPGSSIAIQNIESLIENSRPLYQHFITFSAEGTSTYLKFPPLVSKQAAPFQNGRQIYDAVGHVDFNVTGNFVNSEDVTEAAFELAFNSDGSVYIDGLNGGFAEKTDYEILDTVIPV